MLLVHLCNGLLHVMRKWEGGSKNIHNFIQEKLLPAPLFFIQIVFLNQSLKNSSFSIIGVPLIAVNPFQDVAELYDEAILHKYRTIAPTEVKVEKKILGHFQNVMIYSLSLHNDTSFE